MHHCFAVVRRRSLELNLCRIKFIKKEGVALWQQRRRRAPAHRNRKREHRLEHRGFYLAKRPNRCSAAFVFAAAKSKEDALLLTVRSQY